MKYLSSLNSYAFLFKTLILLLIFFTFLLKYDYYEGKGFCNVDIYVFYIVVCRIYSTAII